MMKDYFKMAWKNMRRRKLRSWLTLIGVMFSIAIIFVLISLSLGLESAVEEQFRLLGTDKFFIQPMGQFGAPGSQTAVKLTSEDLEVIEKVIGVRRAAGIFAGNAKIEFGKEIRYYSVYSITEGGSELYTESGSVEIAEGRLLKDSDRGKINIGSDYTKNIFSKKVSIGDKIHIQGKDFEVIGIYEPIGNPSDDRNIILSEFDFKELFEAKDEIASIIVQIQEGEELSSVVDKTKRKLMNFRDVTEKTRDFSIITPEELLDSFKVILNIVTYFLIGIAGISLVVGAIGIANTMYTSVLERTKEIGVMKAIGARNEDILGMFIVESGLIGIVGGVIGVILGMVIGKIIEYVAVNNFGTTLLKVVFPYYLILGCLVFAFLIGAFSGLFPAWNASRTKIVDAIRYE